MRPQALAALADFEAGNQAAHAVADEHFAVEPRALRRRVRARGERRVEAVQLRAQPGGRFPDGQPGGIKEKPKLVAAPDLVVGEQLVHCLAPRLRARHEAVDENHGNFAGLVGLELVKPHAVQIFHREHQRHHVQRAVRALRDKQRQGGGKISSQPALAPADPHRIRLKRANETQLRRARSVECQHRRHGHGHPRRRHPRLAGEKCGARAEPRHHRQPEPGLHRAFPQPPDADAIRRHQPVGRRRIEHARARANYDQSPHPGGVGLQQPVAVIFDLHDGAQRLAVGAGVRLVTAQRTGQRQPSRLQQRAQPLLRATFPARVAQPLRRRGGRRGDAHLHGGATPGQHRGRHDRGAQGGFSANKRGHFPRP